MSIQSSDTQLPRENQQRLQATQRNKSLSWVKVSDEGVLAAIVEQSEKQMLKDLETGVRSRDSLRFNVSVRSSEAGNFSLEDHRRQSITRAPVKRVQLDSSLLKIDDPLKCRPVPNEPIYKKIFKEKVCDKIYPEVKEPLTEQRHSLETNLTGTSKKLNDSAHRPSLKSHATTSSDSVRDFHLSTRKPENEINFVGGLGPCVGNKRSDKHPQRPTTVQKIYRMRTGNYPVISLTENPRKTHCAVPRHKHKLLPLKEVAEKVVAADNVDSATPSATSILECEVFDLENPMNLDLQGQDYRQTYENDEQEIENAREYYHQLLHMKRKLMKAEIEKLSEERERKKKYAVPEFFDPDADFEESEKEGKEDNDEESLKGGLIEKPFPAYKKKMSEEIQVQEEPEVLAQLFRTTTKPENQAIIENELNRRTDRYYQLWVRRKDKEFKAAEALAEENKLKAENLVMDLGEQFFEELLKDKYQECLELYGSLPPVHVKRRYPHTLRETKRLKQKMAELRNIEREKALIRAKVFESKGIVKNNPPIPPEPQFVSEGVISLSEQSTDDEDDCFVGKKKDEEAYQLRGFHYKLDTEPRGLKDRKHKTKLERPPRTCQTRSSWFRQLVPDVSPPAFFQYNPSSLKRSYQPNDSDINLFPPEFKTVKDIQKAPIKEHLQNTVSDNYAKSKQVRLKIKKPKYIKVKKFTLTGYMYGAKKQKKIRERSRRTADTVRKEVFEKFFQQVQSHSDDKRQERRAKR